MKSIGLSVQEKKRKIYYKMAVMAAILDFRSKQFSYFLSTNHFHASYQVSNQLNVFSGEETKIIFSRRYCSHLGFQSESILDIFNPLVTLLRPTRFQDNWPFSSGREAKIRFSRWLPWWQSWTANWNYFSYFYLQGILNACYQVSNQLAFLLRRRSRK